MVTINANQRVASLVQGSFQTDDNELERVRRMRPDIVSNLRDVRVVEGGINLVQDEEGRWLVTKRPLVCHCAMRMRGQWTTCG